MPPSGQKRRETSPGLRTEKRVRVREGEGVRGDRRKASGGGGF